MIGIGSGLQQQFEHGGVARSSGKPQRLIAIVIFGMHIGPHLDQFFDDSQITIHGGDHQCAHGFVDTGMDQLRCRIGMAEAVLLQPLL
ncbi:MAG: hypothetical protein COS35_03285 [Zetaproteobacteria bacterium CG02_land_8_20_14_3_00_50_9]|nr:MAG: hypothetical protein COS35_03285 [Zetaproteobacteria bacterium CG02_land_8_20_14_3_00_50_9]PIY57132.1 MAG: hypothetical protein COZ00_00440 [Zetaproteobacteria bacterium CG_4_10_14_0_8_um_filter_49_80]